jgi:hypothetical protein
MWVKIAYPTGACRLDAQGRRRAVKRKQKRVVLSALGVWPDGHWEIVPWKVAEGERADTWKAFFGELYLKGVPEATTALVVSDGANGLESALDYHLYGVAHQRCIFHKIKQLADHLVFGELKVEPRGDAEQAARQAKRQRKKAVLVEASWVYCSGRQGLNLAGESPAISIARFGYVAMPQFVEGNHTSIAWCKRPGCPMACYRAVAVGATWRPSKYGSLNISE